MSHMKDEIGGGTPLAPDLVVGFEEHISSRLPWLHCHKDNHLWALIGEATLRALPGSMVLRFS